MRYFVEVFNDRGAKLLWVNGGIGYREEELPRIIRKLENHPRVVKYRIFEKGDK